MSSTLELLDHVEEGAGAALGAAAIGVVAAKKKGWCTGEIEAVEAWFEARPRLLAATAALLRLLSSGFFVYDVYTDWDLYLAVKRTKGRHALARLLWW